MRTTINTYKKPTKDHYRTTTQMEAIFGKDEGISTGNIPTWAILTGIISMISAAGYVIYSLMAAETLANRPLTKKERKAADRKIKKKITKNN